MDFNQHPKIQSLSKICSSLLGLQIKLDTSQQETFKKENVSNTSVFWPV